LDSLFERGRDDVLSISSIQMPHEVARRSSEGAALPGEPPKGSEFVDSE
jgi:hypothetical protein